MTPGWGGFHKYPALVLSALLATGIWAGRQLPAAAVTPLFGLAAVATALTAVTLRLRPGRTAAFVRSLCCLLLCLTIGALKYRSDDAGSILAAGSRQRHTTAIIGQVIDAPHVTGNRVRFLVRVRSVIDDSLVSPCEEKGIVTCSGTGSGPDIASIRYGWVLALCGPIESPPESGNPGEFSPRQYYNANGISFVMRVRGRQYVRILDTCSGAAFMRTVVLPLRTHVLSEIDRDVGGEEGEFLKGLMIGERTGLSPGVQRAFLDSGVAHILAVSGSNVAVVAGAVLAVISFFRVSKAVSRLLMACALVMYMLVTGSQPPVVRATIMALSLFLGDSVGRRVHPLQSVGLAALIMLTADARQLFDIGFQLSFGAVIAILLLTPRLLGMVTHRGHRTLVWGVVRTAYSLFAVSIAASVGTLPLTGMAFGRLSIVGFIANLIIVPATGVSVVLGIISAAVAPIHEWVASSYASLNRLVLMLTIEGAERAASVPWATVDTLWFRPIDALSYYTVLACFIVLGNPPLARRMFIASLAAINVSLFWPSADIAEFMAGECRIVMIDVGQGDAILLQSPGGQNVLVDTGPPSRDGSPWGTSVVPLLKRLDVQSLDAVIITHFHDDHAGGLMQVLRTCNVRRLVVPPHIVRTAGALLDRIEVPVTVASRGDILGDSLCRFYVLDPEEVDSNTPGDLNNQSLVVKMQFGGVSVLLMGDAERDEENRLVSCFGGFLESAILKIGHHGSKAGTGEEFLSVVRPEFALISVGRTNRFGHPAGSTVQRLEGAGVEVFRTDESGAVFMATNGRMIRQLHWR